MNEEFFDDTLELIGEMVCIEFQLRNEYGSQDIDHGAIDRLKSKQIILVHNFKCKWFAGESDE